MGVAKYRAYQELQEAGVDISAEECASMSMRELRDLLAKSGVDENEEKDKHAGMGYGQGRGAHNGNRAGDYGSGNENRNSNGSNSVDDNSAREQYDNTKKTRSEGFERVLWEVLAFKRC